MIENKKTPATKEQFLYDRGIRHLNFILQQKVEERIISFL